MQLVLLAVLPSLAAVLAQTAPTVTVTNGTIAGAKCPAKDVNAFFSIPYAVPPLGNNRFANPIPYDTTYNGTLNATIKAPACIQFGTQFIEYGAQSEDCLYLDIWAPANATSASGLPVKVWIYGGGNAAGGISDVLYNGCFADTDAVQVNINFRLGPIGWMALEAAGLAGNYGLRDILLALNWIQENIEAFGGDKNKVFTYGQSAGAINVYAIATSAEAKSLMSFTAMESGAGTDLPTYAEAQKLYELFATQLNCSISDVACLRAATPEDMNTTSLNFPDFGIGLPGSDSLLGNAGYGIEWGPIIDGDIIPQAPVDAGLKVPSIIGTTESEGTLFVLGAYLLGFESLNETDYWEFLEANFGSVSAAINESYPITDYSSVFQAMNVVITDYGYRCPSYRALLSAEPGVPVYTYRFNHTPSCTWLNGIPGAAIPILGATHTSELPFVFGIFSDLPYAGNCTLSTAEQMLSLAMQTSWTNMATNGTPGGDWPVYSTNTSLGMIYNDAPSVGVVNYSMCSFWENIDAQVAKVAENVTVVPANGTATRTSSVPTSTNAGTAVLPLWGAFSALMIAAVAVLGSV